MQRRSFHFALTIVLLLALASYIRLFFTVSVGDEAWVVLLAYLPKIGGHWFVNEVNIVQTGSILASPLVLLYGWLVGTTGIILYVRHLHFIFTLILAFQAFRLFRRNNSPAVALLLSSVLFTFVPTSISTLSYNTLGSIFFGFATILATLAFEERRKELAALSAVCWVVCVFAYPTQLISFFAFAIPALVFALKNDERRREFFKPFTIAILISAAGAILILALCGLDHVWANFMDSRKGGAGSIEKLYYAAEIVWWYLPSPTITLPLALAWAVVGVFSLDAGAWLFFALIAATLIKAAHPETAPLQALWPVLLIYTPGYLLQRRFKFSELEKKMLWLIVLPAAVGALINGLSSMMTLYSMCLAGLYGAIALTSMILARREWIGWVCALTLTVSSAYWHWAVVYEDGPIEELTSQLRSGPFAGLFTFPEKAAWIENIQDAIDEFKIHGKTVIFKDFFPAGYMMADNTPLGPSTFLGPAIFYQRFRALYFEQFQNRAYWPDFVLDLKYYPVNPTTHWPYSVVDEKKIPDPFKNFFQKTGAYDIVADRPGFQLLEKKSNAQ